MKFRKPHILFFWILVFVSGSLRKAHAQNNSCDCTPFEQMVLRQQQSGKPFSREDLQALRNSSQSGCAIRALELKAELMVLEGKADSGLIFLTAAEKLYRSCKNYDKTNFLKWQSLALHNKGDYAQSLDASFALITLYEKKEEYYGQINTLLLVAQTFNRMKQSSQGREYTYKAMRYLDRLTEPSEKVLVYGKLASRLLWYFQDTKDTVLLDSSEVFIRRQLQISHRLKDSFQLAKGYNLMNAMAHERANYVKALRFNDSCIFYLNGSEREGLLSTAYGDKADILMELKRFSEARIFADSCLAVKIRSGNPDQISNAYALIYQVSNRSGNYKDALWALESYYEIQDSLTNVKKTREVTELEQKYNQARNEKTIRELGQQKQIYGLLLLAALLVVIIGLFIFRQQTLKNKQKILETEQRLNRSRMNPHFFFNTLSSLQYYALQGKDKQELASGISRFSHIMRETLESTYKEYVTVEEEMDFLREYLELQLIRFPGKFTYQLQADASLDTSDLLIPSMILQPFAENSIEHGFEGIDYTGQLDIRFEQVGKELKIQTIDNGRGLAEEQKKESGHTSRAQQIVRDRIYLLNLKLKTKARFSIENNTNEPGVRVQICLPLLYNNTSAVTD